MSGPTGRFLQIDASSADAAFTLSNLLLTELRGTAEISAPFRYDVKLATPLPDSEMLKLLGRPATLWLGNTLDTPGRPMHGIFRQISGAGPAPRVGWSFWTAELVPVLAFLSYAQNTQIFQNVTPVAAVTAVLTQYGITFNLAPSLKDSYPVLDYCVQYRETALNFISRMLAYYGLYYWFEHSDGAHLMIIADNAVASSPVSAVALELAANARLGDIATLGPGYAFQTGTWTVSDYDFTVPATRPGATQTTLVNDAMMKAREVFEHPVSLGDTDISSQNMKDIATTRIEQMESQYHHLHGTGWMPRFDPGFKATIAAAEERTLLLLKVVHEARDMTGFGTEDAPDYSNRFVGLPVPGYAYRPPRTHQKPFVHGPQTAVVTGPDNGAPNTDQYGRVTVKFHWDRSETTGTGTSCLLRVAQIWAGQDHTGAFFNPRVGDEVIVDFLEGDPDRPIITGRVYNGDNMPPYGLPASQTKSGIRTQSVAAAGPVSGRFNELSFEDTANGEGVYLRAQHDFTRQVLNNETATITANQTTTISGSQYTNVTGSVTEDVGVSLTTTVPNMTINANTSVTINTPSFSAYQTNSTTVCDSSSTAVATAEEVAMFSWNLIAMEVTVVPLYLAFKGTNMCFNGMAVTQNSVEMASAITKLDTTAAAISQVGTDIKSGAIGLMQLAAVMIM